MLTATFLFATLSVGNKAALVDLTVSEVGFARIDSARVDRGRGHGDKYGLASRRGQG